MDETLRNSSLTILDTTATILGSQYDLIDSAAHSALSVEQSVLTERQREIDEAFAAQVNEREQAEQARENADIASAFVHGLPRSYHNTDRAAVQHQRSFRVKDHVTARKIQASVVWNRQDSVPYYVIGENPERGKWTELLLYGARAESTTFRVESVKTEQWELATELRRRNLVTPLGAAAARRLVDNASGLVTIYNGTPGSVVMQPRDTSTRQLRKLVKDQNAIDFKTYFAVQNHSEGKKSKDLPNSYWVNFGVPLKLAELAVRFGKVELLERLYKGGPEVIKKAEEEPQIKKFSPEWWHKMGGSFSIR